MRRKIYVASSWRNQIYPQVVELLQAEGHEVYDFRNPEPGNHGFHWTSVGQDWQNWGPAEYITKITASRVARDGFGYDLRALNWCDTCVLVLPCGRSAHLEAGYTIGQGKDTFILLNEADFEPELMYLLATRIVSDTSDLLLALED